MGEEMKTYTFHHDDGHGWLEVPFADLKQVGLSLSDISRYSYTHLSKAYVPLVFLEEDLDVMIFMLAAKRAGIKVAFSHREVPGSSVIRTYAGNVSGKKFDSTELRMLAQACEIEGVFA